MTGAIANLKYDYNLYTDAYAGSFVVYCIFNNMCIFTAKLIKPTSSYSIITVPRARHIDNEPVRLHSINVNGSPADIMLALSSDVTRSVIQIISTETGTFYTTGCYILAT